MKISYNWLQTYFKEKLPTPEKVADAFTFHAFEVEGVEKIKGDTIFDIKVLPDRAHYALCHKGVALEISAILKLKLHDFIVPEAIVTLDDSVKVKIEDDLACPRYTARLIKGVKVNESPKWLSGRLESIGQRSINNIVDITNYVLLDKGQPLHAFDADKIKGTLSLRYAKNNEKLKLLDDRVVELDETVLIEADDKGPLAIAGIKGGKNEGIDKNTKNIILVSGNFNASTVRKTSMKLGIRSDASKRFENNLSPYISKDGLEYATSLILEQLPKVKIGAINDKFSNPPKPVVIDILLEDLNSLLGINIPEKDVCEILNRIDIKYEKNGNKLKLEIPLYRNDLRDINDISEEVGRIYGYDKLKPSLPVNTGFKSKVEKTFYYIEKIKNILTDLGFSEVYTYSLVSKGNFEIEKSLASDKNFLRANLTDGIVRSLDLNVKNAYLLGLSEIKIFEIGKVFPKNGEQTSLVIGIKNVNKKQEKEKDKIKMIRDYLLNNLKVEYNVLCTVDDTGGLISMNGKTIGITNNTEGVLEMNIDVLVLSLPEVKNYNDLKLDKAISIEYKKFSQFPFISRDIALFVPSSVKSDEAQSKIQKVTLKSAGDLLVKGPDLFDEFEKEGKKSFAFRMVFQAQDRTLSDEEINRVMNEVYSMAKKNDWQVR